MYLKVFIWSQYSALITTKSPSFPQLNMYPQYNLSVINVHFVYWEQIAAKFP